MKSTYVNNTSDPFNAQYRNLANNYNFSAGALDYSSITDPALANMLNAFNIYADQDTVSQTINYQGTSETCFVGDYDPTATGAGSNKGVWLEMVQLEININWTTTNFTYNGTAQGKTGSVTGILTSQTVTFYVEKVGGDLALTPIAGNGALKITDLTSTDAGTYYAKLKITDHNYVLASGDEVNWEIKKLRLVFLQHRDMLQMVHIIHMARC